MDSETRQVFESIEALTCPQGLYDQLCESREPRDRFSRQYGR